MNLEINIKVPLGGADVSVARPVEQTVPEPLQYVPTDAFPPALDPGRSLPWGEPERSMWNGKEAAEFEAEPPSLDALGLASEPRPDARPPSLQELGGSSAFAGVNGGVPPGLDGVDLLAAALAVVEEPPPPPELELEEQAASALHAPPLPDELILQTRPLKGKG
jgi:hypothetical protein